MSDFDPWIDWEAAARAAQADQEARQQAEISQTLSMYTPSQNLGKIEGLPTNPLDPNTASLGYKQGAYSYDGYWGQPIWSQGNIIGYEFVKHDITPGMMSVIRTDTQGNIANTQLGPEGEGITLRDAISMAAPFVSLAVPGLGTALGSALGASGTAASAIGSGLIGGTLAEAQGGDFLKGALTGAAGSLAAPVSGSISEAVGGGTLGNVIGQSATSAGMAALTGGDVEQAALMGALTGAAKPIDVGMNTPLTPAQIEAGLGTEGYGYSTAAAESGLFNPAVIGSGAYTQTSYPIDMAELAAADAIQLAQQTGNNPVAMEQNLVASGLDPLIAADLSQQVVLNPTATSMDLANNLIQTYGSDIYDKSIEQINAEKEAAIQPEVSAVTPQTEIPWDKIGKLVAGMLTGGAAMATANQPAPTPMTTSFYQPLMGVPSYNPEYFQSVQQYYNSYMPNMPQDVVTPLSDWYSSGYNEPDSVTASLFNIPLK